MIGGHCWKCAADYYLSASATCTAVPANCATKVNNLMTIGCSACSTGFYLAADAITCTTAVANCKTTGNVLN